MPRPDSLADQRPALKDGEPSALERRLAIAVVSVIGLSVACIALILMAALIGGKWLPSGIGLIAMLGFPIGFALLVALLIVASRRRSRYPDSASR